MRILWLSAGLLLPLDKGGKLRTWHLMRHLAQRHEITFVAFADPGTSPADREKMRDVCAQLHLVPRRDTVKGTFAFYGEAAARLFDPLPYAVGKYRSREYRAKVQELLDTGTFDRVVCDFLVPAVNMPTVLPCPSVLFTHNVEADIWRRHYERRSNAVSRLALRQQWERMLRFEGQTVGRFDLVLAVSDIDRDTLHRLYEPFLRQPVVAVATGVDTTYFAPRTTDVMPRRLVFTGSMDWIRNQAAMTHFCRDILPRVRAQEPDVTLAIVGRAPTPAVRRLAEIPGVDVTGRVDDVRGFIEQAAVYIVPIRIGGGTRLKIFEAMAMGKAVVSTTVGAEGLPVSHGENVWIADSPEAFADAIVMLLRNPAARLQLEEAARRLVVRAFDWSVVATQFEEALITEAHVSRVGRALTARLGAA
jgi:polysaccharide biosynthesis protein PslH